MEDENKTTEGPSTDAPKEGSVAPQNATKDLLQGSSRDAPHNRKKRPCGAELKRRRKTRMAAEALANAASSLSLTSKGKQPAKGGVGQPIKKGKAQPPQPAKSLKRGRSAGSTPSPHQTMRKKARPAGDPARSYVQAAQGHLYVAVINRREQLSRLTADQAALVQSKLHEALVKTLTSLKKTNQPPPTFAGMRHAGEILRITCNDVSSREWLEETVDSIKIDGLELTVVRVDELPRMTKVSLWIPGPPEDKKAVLGYLEAQNPELNIRGWCCFHAALKEESNGQLLIMGVSDKDATLLRNRAGKLNYCLPL